ncbi:MAG TPA: chloride channel protein [Chromatiales bacterium]|nr:chloride channel protein [Chromatiales bacterium]
MTYRKHLARTYAQLRSPRAWRTRVVFWGGALTVGVAATALALSSAWADEQFHGWAQRWNWLPLLLTPAGILAITWFTRTLFPGGEGSGIPQAIAALHVRQQERRDAVLSLRIAIGKSVAIVAGLLCGASIGREGPTVHIAASIMHGLSRLTRFPAHHLDRGLILAGAGAGLAAAFNTPLAGLIFVIEEMAQTYEQRTSGTVFVAVMLAGMTALALQGNYTYFGNYATAVDPIELIVPILSCGICGGLMGGLFAALLIHGGKWLMPWRARHPYWLAAGCALAVAILGIASGGITWGTGYGQARLLLEGHADASLAYAPLKLLATVFSYWSGIPGGIFAPSLSAGAGVGAVLAPLFPDVAWTAVALLGMVAYFTGVVQTPITAVVIIMEMTNDHAMLLPMMATALIAEWCSRLVCHRPLYRVLAEDYMGHLPQSDSSSRPNP